MKSAKVQTVAQTNSVAKRGLARMRKQLPKVRTFKPKAR